MSDKQMFEIRSFFWFVLACVQPARYPFWLPAGVGCIAALASFFVSDEVKR